MKSINWNKQIEKIVVNKMLDHFLTFTFNYLSRRAVICEIVETDDVAEEDRHAIKVLCRDLDA